MSRFTLLTPNVMWPGTRPQRAVTWLQLPARARAAFVGAKPLGRGSFAWVWAAADGSRVLKFTTDPASAALLRAQLRAPSPSLPMVDWVSPATARSVNGSHLGGWVVQLERLWPLDGADEKAVLALYKEASRTVPPKLTCVHRRSLALLDGLQRQSRRAPFPRDRSLRATLADLQAFVAARHFCVDLLHSSNWMKRADGSWVLSDPVINDAVEV